MAVFLGGKSLGGEGHEMTFYILHIVWNMGGCYISVLDCQNDMHLNGTE